MTWTQVQKKKSADFEIFVLLYVLPPFRLLHLGARGLQSVHLPSAAGIWRRRADANVSAIRQRHQLQSVHRSGHQSEQVLRYAICHLAASSHVFSESRESNPFDFLFTAKWPQVSSVSTIQPAPRRPFKRWTGSRSAWSGSKCSSNDPKTPIDPTDLRHWSRPLPSKPSALYYLPCTPLPGHPQSSIRC